MADPTISVDDVSVKVNLSMSEEINQVVTDDELSFIEKELSKRGYTLSSSVDAAAGTTTLTIGYYEELTNPDNLAVDPETISNTAQTIIQLIVDGLTSIETQLSSI